MTYKTRTEKLRYSRLYAERLLSRGIKQRIFRLSDSQKVYVDAFIKFLKETLGDDIQNYTMSIDDNKMTIKFKERKQEK